MKRQTCKRKKAVETFGTIACSSLIKVVGFLLRLHLGIESGKIFMLKTPRVSSLKAEAESRLSLAGLRKC